MQLIEETSTITIVSFPLFSHIPKTSRITVLSISQLTQLNSQKSTHRSKTFSHLTQLIAEKTKTTVV